MKIFFIKTLLFELFLLSFIILSPAKGEDLLISEVSTVPYVVGAGIGWKTNVPVDVVIYYGTASNTLDHTKNVNTNYTIQYGNLVSLLPQTTYFYKIVATTKDGSSSTETPVASFTTFGEPSLELTYPNGGESFMVGDSLTITWKQKNLSSLTLHAITQSGVVMTPAIFESLKTNENETAGSFIWRIPNDFLARTTSRKYKLEILGYGHSVNDLRIESEDYFTIATPDDYKASEAKKSDYPITFSLPNAPIAFSGTYKASWASACTGGRYSLWLSLATSTSKDGYAIQPLHDVDYDPFTKQYKYFAQSPNSGSASFTVPEAYGMYQEYRFDPYRLQKYVIYTTTNGATIMAHEIENGSFSDLIGWPYGKYRLFLLIYGNSPANCIAYGFSDYFNIDSVAASSQISPKNAETPVAQSEIVIPPETAQKNILPFNQVVDPALVSRLKGRIILQTESRGEAWYVNPTDGKRYYMQDGNVAYQALRKFGIGITNADLKKITIGMEARFQDLDTDTDGLPDKLEEAIGTDSRIVDYDNDGHADGEEVRNGYNPLGPGRLTTDSRLSNRLRGRILLQVQSKGEAWYINPSDGKRYYMKDGQAAYQIMQFLSLGISNKDIGKIEVASIN